MKKRHPLVSALSTFACTIGGIVACWVLGITLVLVFANQSDEAWNGAVWILFAITAFALPVGVLLAISSYFKMRRPSSDAPQEEKPIQPPELTQ